MAATTDPNTTHDSSQGKEGADTSNTSQTPSLPDKEDVDVIDKTLLNKKSEFEKAIEIGEQLPKDNPENQNDLATAYYNLAVLQIDHLGDYDSAKANYEKAIEIGEQLPKDKTEYQNMLAQAYYRYALLLLVPEEHEAAEANVKSAITISTNKLSDWDEREGAFEFASVCYNFFRHDSLQEDTDLARVNSEKAIEIGEQLPKDKTEYQRMLAQAYYKYAVLLLGAREYEAAEANVKSAITIFKPLTDSNPEYSIDLLKCNCVLVDTYNKRGKLKKAKKILDGIKTQAEKCLSDNPNDSIAQKVNEYIKFQLNDILKTRIWYIIIAIVTAIIIAAIIQLCIWFFSPPFQIFNLSMVVVVILFIGVQIWKRL